MQLITDHQLASSILDYLGYTLEDLSLNYGDVVIPQGDISHQIYYNNSLLGHIWQWKGSYHTSPNCVNRTHPVLAAIDLLPQSEVLAAMASIQAARNLVPDYI